ncbi:MAG: proprotein convertase P-domain-containing protein [Ignavibacteria bacterium]|nr:proprotein convertase P-domain-containing protein [Ignavibacteria bacterium]
MKQKYIFLAMLFSLISSVTLSQMFWHQAVSFNGTSDITIPASPSTDITGSFTVEAWVSPTTTGLQNIMAKGNSRYDFRISSSSPGGRIAIRTNGTTRLTAKVSSSLTPNVWTHVAATYEVGTNTFSLFINGVLDTSAVIAGAAPTSAVETVTIGDGFNGNFTGLIDEARIWNRALTATELSKNMFVSLGATGGVYDGLVLSMTMQNSYGSSPTSLTDWSGNGNTGTNNGAVFVNYSGKPSRTTYQNQSLVFDGASWVAGPDNAAVSPTAAITLEAWIFPKTNVGTQPFINKGNALSNYQLRLTSTTNVLAAVINGVLISSTTVAVPVNRWSHVAFTYTPGGTYKFFLNGNLGFTGTDAAPLLDGADSLIIGRYPGGSLFTGYVDEVRISNYAKPDSTIQQYVYRSIDQSNEPFSGNVNVVYNFDGYGVDNCSDGGPRMYFRNNARFSIHNITGSSSEDESSTSPLNRWDAGNFSRGWYMKTSDRLIPNVGVMTVDSLNVSPGVSMTDVNLFIGLNHTYVNDLRITLVAPNGDSSVVFNGNGGSENDLVTIFDDQADSTIAGLGNTYIGGYTRIKPSGVLNTPFSGDQSAGIWRLRIIDGFAGDEGRVYSWGIQINNAVFTGVNQIASEIPLKFMLHQNYPNPFNPVTSIKFAIPSSAFTVIKVYDIIGREVAKLVDKQLSAGTYEVTFDGKDFASGVYFYRIESADFVDVKKMMLVK